MAVRIRIDPPKTASRASTTHREKPFELARLRRSERPVVSIGYKKDELVRFNLNLSPATADVVRKVAESKEISVTDVFRRALAIMETMDDEVANGRAICSIDGQGNATEFEIL